MLALHQESLNGGFWPIPEAHGMIFFLSDCKAYLVLA